VFLLTSKVLQAFALRLMKVQLSVSVTFIERNIFFSKEKNKSRLQAIIKLSRKLSLSLALSHSLLLYPVFLSL
jgi:hypothetical protein